MPRSQKVSNGEVTLYGKVAYDPLARDAHWRSRISSEGVGVRQSDSTGSSTAVSMLWCPSVEQDTSGKSQRRSSELKIIQDLGIGPGPSSAQAPAAAPPTPARSVTPSQRSVASRASQRSGTSVDTAFLTSEDARLQASPAPRPPTLKSLKTSDPRCEHGRRPRTSASSGRPTYAWGTSSRRRSTWRSPKGCWSSRRHRRWTPPPSPRSTSSRRASETPLRRV